MSVNISEIFGENVFSMSVMRERLPKKAYAEVVDVMEHGGNITMATADIVANAMKDWAVEKGATHYTHWFQPLTGVTAEKHEGFLGCGRDGSAIIEFSGKELIMSDISCFSRPYAHF